MSDTPQSLFYWKQPNLVQTPSGNLLPSFTEDVPEEGKVMKDEPYQRLEHQQAVLVRVVIQNHKERV